MNKITRQLYLYRYLSYHEIYGPEDIMDAFGISRRMLQRDLKDFRDSGLMNLKYNKKEDRYIDKGDAHFNENAAPRRKQQLQRLYRLCTLLSNLSFTYASELQRYEEAVKEFEDYLNDIADDPEENTPENIESMREFWVPEEPRRYDLKTEYYALFPNSNERTRQRDFNALACVDFNIYYDRKKHTFINEYDDENEPSFLGF